MNSPNNKKEITDEELDSLFKKKPKSSTAHFVKKAAEIPVDTVVINPRKGRSGNQNKLLQFLPLPLAAAIVLVCSMIVYDSRPQSVDLPEIAESPRAVVDNFEILELQEKLEPVSFIAEIDPEMIESINLLIDYKYEI